MPFNKHKQMDKILGRFPAIFFTLGMAYAYALNLISADIVTNRIVLIATALLAIVFSFLNKNIIYRKIAMFLLRSVKVDREIERDVLGWYILEIEYQDGDRSVCKQSTVKIDLYPWGLGIVGSGIIDKSTREVTRQNWSVDYATVSQEENGYILRFIYNILDRETNHGFFKIGKIGIAEAVSNEDLKKSFFGKFRDLEILVDNEDVNEGSISLYQDVSRIRVAWMFALHPTLLFMYFKNIYMLFKVHQNPNTTEQGA